MKVKAGISNRHVHLTEETYYQLFDNAPTFSKELNQKGEYVIKETLILKTDKGEFQGVKIILPFRTYDQIEISKRDAIRLGINPPIRNSGDVYSGAEVILKTEKSSVKTTSCIIAARHIHMNFLDAKKYDLRGDEEVYVVVEGEKGGFLKSRIKVSEDGVLEFHIDTDDAAAINIQNGDILEVVKCHLK